MWTAHMIDVWAGLIQNVAALASVIAVRPAHMVIIPIAVGRAIRIPSEVSWTARIVVIGWVHQFVRQQQRVAGAAPFTDHGKCYTVIVDDRMEARHPCNSEQKTEVSR